MAKRDLSFDQFPYDTIAVISPHPDDGVLGCGGLLGRLAARTPKVQVHVVVMTGGWTGVDDRYLREYIKKGRGQLKGPDALKSDLNDWLGSCYHASPITAADAAFDACRGPYLEDVASNKEAFEGVAGNTPGYSDFLGSFRRLLNSLADALRSVTGGPTISFDFTRFLRSDEKKKLEDNRKKAGPQAASVTTDDEQRATNVLKTAIRFRESCDEAAALGVDRNTHLHFLALPALYDRRLADDELEALATLLLRIAPTTLEGRHPLLMMPHPGDPQSAHRISTQAALDARAPESKWHVWYYQSPWYTMPADDIHVVISLDGIEYKKKGAKQHKSQTARTPYDGLIEAEAKLLADALPEQVLGFGVDRPFAFGEFCEVYSVHSWRFLYPDKAAGGVVDIYGAPGAGT